MANHNHTEKKAVRRSLLQWQNAVSTTALGNTIRISTFWKKQQPSMLVPDGCSYSGAGNHKGTGNDVSK